MLVLILNTLVKLSVFLYYLFIKLLY